MQLRKYRRLIGSCKKISAWRDTLNLNLTCKGNFEMIDFVGPRFCSFFCMSSFVAFEFELPATFLLSWMDVV